ncbi:unnamed protein product [Closterium sp. NIES-65]|nr:unnamed protein product [Closterium sp. NIES-65]
MRLRKQLHPTALSFSSSPRQGIVYVVDCGFVKQRFFDPVSNVDALLLVPVSRASAQQRAGRAGRVRPGKCYRLYTEHSYLTDLAAHTIPEIQRSDLTATVLQLKSLGIDNIMRFDWLSPPAPSAMIRALETLFAVRALDMDGRLTRPVGVQLAEFPLDPLIAFMLLVSANAPGTTADGATGTAMKSGGGGGGVGGGKEEDDEEEEDGDGEDADGCSEEMCTVAASLCVQVRGGECWLADGRLERLGVSVGGQQRQAEGVRQTQRAIRCCRVRPAKNITQLTSLQRQPLPHCNANPFLTATPTPSSLQRQPLPHCNANPFLTATPTPSSLQRQPLPHCNANPFLTATPNPSSLQRQPLPHCNANPFLTATPTPSSVFCNANPFLCVLQRQPLPLCSVRSMLSLFSHQGDFGDFVSYLNVAVYSQPTADIFPRLFLFGPHPSFTSPYPFSSLPIPPSQLRVDDVRGRLRRGLRRFSNLPPHPSPPLLVHPHSSLPLPAPTSQLRVDDVRGQLRKGLRRLGLKLLPCRGDVMVVPLPVPPLPHFCCLPSHPHPPTTPPHPLQPRTTPDSTSCSSRQQCHLLSLLATHQYFVPLSPLPTPTPLHQLLQRAAAASLFVNAAQLMPDGDGSTYKSVRGNLHLKIHPSSVLFRVAPQWVVYRTASQVPFYCPLPLPLHP